MILNKLNEELTIKILLEAKSSNVYEESLKPQNDLENLLARNETSQNKIKKKEGMIQVIFDFIKKNNKKLTKLKEIYLAQENNKFTSSRNILRKLIKRSTINLKLTPIENCTKFNKEECIFSF